MASDSSKQTAAAPISGMTDRIYTQLAARLAQPKSAKNLEQALRLLSMWRSTLLANTIIAKDGVTVQAGPFAGMTYVGAGSEGSTASRLLGTYETSLHPIVAQITRTDYQQIVDVGCAEGYYAVGFARLMPHVQVLAHDLDPVARQKCAELARMNGVADRVQIGGEIGHADFDICARAKTLVICDIEGAEAQLLDPALAKGLQSADVLVEVHDCFTPGLSAKIAQRFAATHDVQLIHRAQTAQPLPEWMDSLSDLDRALALWEWRMGPTPWLWMVQKSAASQAAQTNKKKG